jgi:hypothetical protein
VSFSPRVRVAGFTVFAISQKMSSARTAESAILVEKMMLAIDLEVSCRFLNNDNLALAATPGRCAASWCALRSWPESRGNSFCDTATATKRKVSRNGSDETIVAIGLFGRAIYSGTHSSQSSCRGGSIVLVEVVEWKTTDNLLLSSLLLEYRIRCYIHRTKITLAHWWRVAQRRT